jgi:D-alanyl-D-alanine carboxypeptidase (penicillin-binding protein 5/6)
LIAPLALDAAVGTLHVFAGTQTVATLPLHPLKNVTAGGWWRRIIDTIRLWFVRA